MVQFDIANTVLRGKCVASCWGIDNVNRENAGQDIKCDEMKVMLLIRWTLTLQSYYYDNYNAISGNITPTIDCLTLAQAQALMGKVNALIKQCPVD